jgi:hypothetical protein
MTALTGCETTSTGTATPAAPAAATPAPKPATPATPAATTAPKPATPAPAASNPSGVFPAPAAAAPAGAVQTGIIRIKAGSSEPFKDSAGNVWKAEEGFEGGSTVDRDASLAIANTKDPAFYHNEHYSMDSFSVKVPNGKYTAKLYFAETYEGISGPGQRVFSFNVQGKEFKDFDITVKAGGAQKAYIETVPVEVTNGVFKITFTANVENPEINAIELDPAN